jgi:hypothetical protein
MFLTYLAKKKMTCSELKSQPFLNIIITKNKIQLKAEIDVDKILIELQNKL